MKSRSGKVLLLVCSVAISIVIAEIALRLASAGYLHRPLQGHPVLHHTQPANFEFTSYDFMGEFSGVRVTYNEDGFRIPQRGYEFDDSLKDIVFLGDSFVEASEVPYEQSFVGLFAKDFKNVNVRNFGVSSYSPLLSYLQLNYFMDSLDPRMIVHLVFENDLGDDRVYYNAAKSENGQIVAVPGDSGGAVRQFLWQFYVARLVRRAQVTIQEMVRSSDREEESKISHYLEDPELEPITARYIEKTWQTASEHNVRYLLMCVPSKIKFNEMGNHNDICKKVNDFASDLGIEYVNLDVFFSNNVNGEKPFFDNNIHLNSTGHRLIYLALKEYLATSPERFETLQDDAGGVGTRPES